MELIYPGIFKFNLLMDELLTAFPEWRVGEFPDRKCLLYLVGYDQSVKLSVPDDSNVLGIEAVINAHDSNALSSGEMRQVYIDDANLRLKASVLADKTPQEIYDIVQARIDSWTSLADAKADFREWMPLIFAGMMWIVKRD